jgi:hypothetical protein
VAVGKEFHGNAHPLNPLPLEELWSLLTLFCKKTFREV